MLCKEENVRAGRNTAAGKMKETVVVTVHKGTMKIMDSSKIMDDRVVGNRRIMDTASKMTGTDTRVTMGSKEAMAIMTREITDSVVITAGNKETTGVSMKDMVACRVASVDMEMKDNMVSRADMADSKVGTEATASKAAGVACREDTVNKVAKVACKAATVAMASKAVMDREKVIMMMTIVACRDAIVAETMKTSMTIIAVKRRTMTIMRCRAAMVKEKKDLMKTKKGIMTGNSSRLIPAGVLAACSTTRDTACRAWAVNTDRNMNRITIATRIITVAGKATRMKVNMVEAGRRGTVVWAWVEAAPALRAVALPACQKKKYAA